jgi:signal peptidase I
MTTPKTPAAPHAFFAWLWDWAKSIAVALVVWLILRTFLIQAFRIPSGSMENTLLIGDFLFVNKALYGAEVPLIHKHLPAFREPRRNDVVVFDGVEAPMEIVKRMVGVPGDTLSMEGGQLIRNGERLVEPYVVHASPLPMAAPEQRLQMRMWQVKYLVNRDTATYNPDLQDWGPIVVPPDSFFMMGDSRDNSHDSRMWGFLPRANVRGRPMFIYFSYDAESWKPAPFLTAIRWNRIFSRPR